MFSKNDGAINLKPVGATLIMRNGQQEATAVLVAAHRTLRDVVNDETPFIEIENSDGSHSFVLKSEIARIDPRDLPEPNAARRAPRSSARFNAEEAHVVLGVAAAASAEELHKAWLDLVKAYHPDRLAGLGLPAEMLAHADRILARVNAAYAWLRDARGRE